MDNKAKEATDQLDCTHLETLLDQLEKLSKWGSPDVAAKKKTIIDYVRYLVAMSVTKAVE